MTWQDDPIEICAVCWGRILKRSGGWEHESRPRHRHDVVLIGDSDGIKLRAVPS